MVSYLKFILFSFSTIHFKDHSYIAIAIIAGKILTVSVHISLPPSTPHTPEINGFLSTEKITDDCHPNPINPILTLDKDIALGSLLTARCCFGIASINETIYVVGMCSLIY